MKLQHVTTLVKAYTEARDELVRFVRQHSKEVIELHDPLEEIAALFLDVLYKDYGRELFWQSMRGAPNESKKKNGMASAHMETEVGRDEAAEASLRQSAVAPLHSSDDSDHLRS